MVLFFMIIKRNSYEILIVKSVNIGNYFFIFSDYNNSW